MDITVRELDSHNLHDANKCDGVFRIESKLVLQADDSIISYAEVPVEPYEKTYDLEPVDYEALISNPDETMYFAYLDGQLAGQIRVLKSWNNYAWIDDIVVDIEFRRYGVGRALMNQAIDWAKARGLPGIRLETQNNNVAACRFYERCGFVLAGFDRYLYNALHPGTGEIALFWYLMF